VKTSDIADATMLDALAVTRGKHGVPRWSSLGDVENHMAPIHPKLVLSKLRSMIRRGVIGGCGCGCRGDFEIVATTAKPASETDPPRPTDED